MKLESYSCWQHKSSTQRVSAVRLENGSHLPNQEPAWFSPITLFFSPRRLTIQKWAILRKEVRELLMLNKARRSPKLVIITAEGTNSLITVLEDQVPQLDLTRREGKTGQRHVNHIGRSPSQMPFSDPQGVKERGTSMPCLCARGIERSQVAVWSD